MNLDRYFTADQQKAIDEALRLFRLFTLDSTGVRRISGGFANADVHAVRKTYIRIKLVWGVKSDCENRTNIEFYRLNRYHLELAPLDPTAIVKNINFER